MSARKEARRQRQSLDRVNKVAALNICACGNIAGINNEKCGKCRDRQAAEDAAKLHEVEAVLRSRYNRVLLLVDRWRLEPAMDRARRELQAELWS